MSTTLPVNNGNYFYSGWQISEGDFFPYEANLVPAIFFAIVFSICTIAFMIECIYHSCVYMVPMLVGTLVRLLLWMISDAMVTST
jgi:hypothetical protein